jgi:hypothetical protein
LTSREKNALYPRSEISGKPDDSHSGEKRLLNLNQDHWAIFILWFRLSPEILTPLVLSGPKGSILSGKMAGS